MEASQPLAGRLMLDLTQGIAGPYCGRLMAEHGARVIKIEPPGGDWVREIGGGPGGVSVNFTYYNLGKESVTIDLKTADGLAAALRIAAKADVVAESARPGVMTRLGIGYDAVRAINPGVVYLSVSGFGQDGPRGHEPMTDTVAQAFSGMMSINRGMDGVPHKIGTTIVDAITGLYAFQQVTMALVGGGGACLDVSLMQAAAAIMGPKVMEFAHYGRTPASPNAPAGSYPTSDGWIAITLVREAHFAAIARAIGQPGLAEEARFATFAARLEHLDALIEILSAATRERTTAEWVAAFTAEGVLASAIHDFGEWLAAPQVVATKGAPEVAVSEGVMSPAPRTPGRVPLDRPAPAAGAHTDAVLAEFAASGERRLMRVFVTGATGYIGGSVAVTLARGGHAVWGLTRTDEGAELLEREEIRPVPGTLEDTGVLVEAARKADAVIHAADSDHAGAVRALIGTLEGTGKRLVHTSGSSIVGTPAMGEFQAPEYAETTPFEPSPGRAARVALNAEVLAAVDRGVHATIVAPALIYGPGRIGGRESMQVPWLIETARRHGCARHLGPGTNRWSNVHIADLCDLYARVLTGAPPGAFYWAEAGENAMAELCAAINRMLGIGREPEPMTSADAAAEWGEGPALNTMGSNSRVRAVRARTELGWAPSGPSAIEEIERGHYARIWAGDRP